MAIFTNRATISYDGTEVSSNTAQGELLDPLSVRKYAINDSYSTGNILTYVAVITNTSDSAVSGVSFIDNLGSYSFNGETLYPLTYVDGSIKYFSHGVLQPDPSVALDDNLTVSGLSVPADGEIMIIYQATANNFAPLGTTGSITNTVYAMSAGGTQTETATATVEVDDSANLSVTKNISPVPVTSGGTVTYTFIIQNTGATAANDVVLSDLFDPILTNISVTYNGLAWTETNDYTYDEGTGQFTTVSGSITVPAATYTQSTTGEWSVTPSSVTLVVTGTI